MVTARVGIGVALGLLAVAVGRGSLAALVPHPTRLARVHRPTAAPRSGLRLAAIFIGRSVLPGLAARLEDRRGWIGEPPVGGWATGRL